MTPLALRYSSRLPLLSQRRRLTSACMLERQAQRGRPAPAARPACSRRWSTLVVRASAGSDAESDAEGESFTEDVGGELEVVEEEEVLDMGELTRRESIRRWKEEGYAPYGQVFDEQTGDFVDLLMHGYQYNITGDREVEEARSTTAGSKAAEQPPSRIEAAAALLRDLPGITPEGAIQNPKNLWDECLEANRRIARPSPPLVCDQAVLDKWELRAMIEKRRAREALAEDWERRRSEIGMYPTVSADWRSDVRCRDPGNPTSMGYREWTHQEIWDLITLGGKAADPRAVRVSVEDPLAPGDAVAEGARYEPDIEDWIGEMGMLMDTKDEAAISDRQGEEAMLADAFSDFDDLDIAASFDEFSPAEDF